MSMMHSVQYYTHTLPASEQCSDADEEAKECQRTPASISATDGDDDSINQSSEDCANPEALSERLSWCVTIADCPSDEVGVCLMSE